MFYLLKTDNSMTKMLITYVYSYHISNTLHIYIYFKIRSRFTINCAQFIEPTNKKIIEKLKQMLLINSVIIVELIRSFFKCHFISIQLIQKIPEKRDKKEI